MKGNKVIREEVEQLVPTTVRYVDKVCADSTIEHILRLDETIVD
jgi:hypothetical protein